MGTEKNSLADLVGSLPPDLQSEVRDFVEFLLEKRRRADLEQLAVANGWPADFFAHTVGSVEGVEGGSQVRQGFWLHRSPAATAASSLACGASYLPVFGRGSS
jgi:hypothetical protein